MCEQGNESTEDVNQNSNRREKIFGYIILLTALFSYLLTKIHAHINATAIDFQTYSVLALFLSMIVITLFFIIIYVLVDVISILSNKDENGFLVNMNHSFSCFIYLLILLFCAYIVYIVLVQFVSIPYAEHFMILLSFLIPVGLYAVLFDAKIEGFSVIVVMLISFVIYKISALIGSLLVLALLIMFCIKGILQRKYDLPESVLNILNYLDEMTWEKGVKLFIAFLFIIFASFAIATTTPYSIIIGNLPILHGNMDIQMESDLLTDINPIPFSIVLTGPVSNLNISLLEVDSNFNVSEIDYLTIDTNIHSSNMSVSESRYMVGSTASLGYYEFSLNSSALSTGYYKIKCQRIGFGKDKYVENLFYYKAE